MKNLILIAGAGRNVGKTTLMCLLIEHLCTQHIVTAVKVSSHHHIITEKQKVIYKTEDLTISEEHDQNSTKDSSRYIRAGANRSLFVQIVDNKMLNLILWLQENIKGIIVCESGSMGQFIKPLIAIFVDDDIHLKEPKWNFSYSKTKLIKGEFHPNIKELIEGTF